MTGVAILAAELAAESARLDAEVREIDLLVGQARTEAGRHETRRAAAAEKLAGLGPSTPAGETIELANQAVTLTRRAALMEAQVEILEAKKKALVRLRESIDDHAARAAAIAGTPGGASPTGADAGSDAAGVAALDRAASPAVSRMVLTAQENLRREIARAMHDGPAQSLTNIVLQAEIVERLIGKDPAAVGAEVSQLVAMVQQTLEATKAFIFDVRPMVLDDLGLVPTLRRAARDRGKRAGVVVEFESLGMDRRLAVELESSLFRILDEALAGYLAAHPERVSLRLDWGEDLEAQLTAERNPEEVPEPDLPAAGDALPPALAAMVEERRAGHAEAVAAARRAAIVQLPANAWPDLAGRAASHGIDAQLLDDGGRLRLTTALPTAIADEAGAATPTPVSTPAG